MVFLVRRRGAENIQKKKKTERRKTLKNEEREKRRIQGKSNNSNRHLLFYFLHKKLYFAGNYSLYRHINLQFSCVAGYLKRSNDTPHIFISMGYLILMPEKYLHFRKRC